ncbi:MAG: FtsX-like permease family protein [Nitrospirae bacterium YQR-1]
MNKLLASAIFFLSGFMLAIYPHFLLPLRNFVSTAKANVLNICFIHYHPELYLGIGAMAAAILSFKYKKIHFISILISAAALIHALTLNPVSYYLSEKEILVAANTVSIRAHSGIKYMILTIAAVMLLTSLCALLKKQKKLSPKISIFLYAQANLKMCGFRSSALIAAVSVVTIVTLVSFSVFETVKKTLTLSASRLKADVVVVPQGKETEAFNLITRGEPSLFYFDEGVYEKLLKVQGIGEVSPQLYLQPFSYEIESEIEKVLIVAIDPEHDFIVGPWIEYSIGQAAGLSVGYKVKYYPGQEIKLFGKKRKITAALTPTTVGYLDYAVFIAVNEAKEFITEYKKMPAPKVPKKPLPGMDFMDTNQNDTPDLSLLNPDTFSAVFIKADKGMSVKALTHNIYETVKGVSVIDLNVTSKEEKKLLMSKAKPLIIPAITVILFSAAILFTAFSLIVNERRREIGMIRALGAKRSGVFYGIIIESLLISSIGWFLGIIFGNAIFFAVKNTIMSSLDLLYIRPSLASIISVLALTFTVNIATTLFAVITPAISASRIDPYAAIREG